MGKLYYLHVNMLTLNLLYSWSVTQLWHTTSSMFSLTLFNFLLQIFKMTHPPKSHLFFSACASYAEKEYPPNTILEQMKRSVGKLEIVIVSWIKCNFLSTTGVFCHVLSWFMILRISLQQIYKRHCDDVTLSAALIGKLHTKTPPPWL